jgi:hypothetical protein
MQNKFQNPWDFKLECAKFPSLEESEEMEQIFQQFDKVMRKNYQ